MATVPARIDSDLFEVARTSGELMSRSAAQQISHWARLGRALEASANVRHRDVERVLRGEAPYDALGDAEQALVRAQWDERIDVTRRALDLAEELGAAGDSWSEVDEGGRLVTRARE